jgi:AcrR family transcriptional regulator
MSPTAIARVGRSRNAATTRAAILEAARARFGQQGYDEVGMRDLARDVGVDAAMVSRYFGSKEELFAETLRSCREEGNTLMEGERSDFGRRMAHQLVYEPQNCGKQRALLIMLRATGSAKAAEVVQRMIAEDFLGPFEAWLGGDLAHVRARLASSVIMGVAVSRNLEGEDRLNAAEKQAMFERLAEVLQQCVEP